MKILIIRLSSIGDIVLTTPVIRCLKKQIKGSEIHFLTKKSYAAVLQHNPYIDKLHFWEKNDKVLLKFSPLPQKRKFYEVLRPLNEISLSTICCTSVTPQRAL